MKIILIPYSQNFYNITIYLEIIKTIHINNTTQPPPPYKMTTRYSLPKDTVFNVVQAYTRPEQCSQWFSRTAECPALSWVGWPVQLARGWSGHCTGLTELRNLIFSSSTASTQETISINKTQVLPLFHSPYPDINTITN